MQTKILLAYLLFMLVVVLNMSSKLQFIKSNLEERNLQYNAMTYDTILSQK